MLFSFSKFWKVSLSCVLAWLAYEFVGFEITLISLLVLLLHKKTPNSSPLS